MERIDNVDVGQFVFWLSLLYFVYKSDKEERNRREPNNFTIRKINLSLLHAEDYKYS